MMNKSEKVNDLIQLAQNDKNALGELYELVSLDIYAFALAIVQSKEFAEDIMQEVFINIYKNAKRYKDIGMPMAWILQITKNVSYDILKKQKRITTELTHQYEIENKSVDGFEKDSVNYLLVQELLNKLSKTQREVIVLYLYSKTPQKEIARIQGVSLPTVKWRYKVAKKKLRSIVDENKGGMLNGEI